MSKDISLNFIICDSLSSSSNFVAEAHLEEYAIVFDKKELLSRSKITTQRIEFADIIELNLIQSKNNSLEYSIYIKYSQSEIYLKTSDIFAVKWFYDNLIELFDTFNKKIADKKANDFNNFITQISNSKPSLKDSNSIKKKEKFYNFCYNTEN